MQTSSNDHQLGQHTVSDERPPQPAVVSQDHVENVAPQVSVIVPTYREAANIPTLCERLFTALDAHQIAAELIVVDDNSRDGTIEAVADLALRYPIRLIVRENERGLSSAVVAGFAAARAPLLVCMDADLSHPPERVPDVLAPIKNNDAEFCVGSRYVAGAAIEQGWGVLRALNSGIATVLARPLTPLRDPMAGFFCTTKDIFQRAQRQGLKPLGYKIGLEICVRGGVNKTCEVAIQFNDRHAGESKLGFKQQIEYLAQIVLLYAYQRPGLVIAILVVFGATAASIAQFLF